MNHPISCAADHPTETRSINQPRSPSSSASPQYSLSTYLLTVFFVFGRPIPHAFHASSLPPWSWEKPIHSTVDVPSNGPPAVHMHIRFGSCSPQAIPPQHPCPDHHTLHTETHNTYPYTHALLNTGTDKSTDGRQEPGTSVSRQSNLVRAGSPRSTHQASHPVPRWRCTVQIPGHFRYSLLISVFCACPIFLRSPCYFDYHLLLACRFLLSSCIHGVLRRG